MFSLPVFILLPSFILTFTCPLTGTAVLVWPSWIFILIDIFPLLGGFTAFMFPSFTLTFIFMFMFSLPVFMFVPSFILMFMFIEPPTISGELFTVPPAFISIPEFTFMLIPVFILPFTFVLLFVTALFILVLSVPEFTFMLTPVFILPFTFALLFVTVLFVFALIEFASPLLLIVVVSVTTVVVVDCTFWVS